MDTGSEMLKTIFEYALTPMAAWIVFIVVAVFVSGVTGVLLYHWHYYAADMQSIRKVHAFYGLGVTAGIFLSLVFLILLSI